MRRFLIFLQLIITWPTYELATRVTVARTPLQFVLQQTLEDWPASRKVISFKIQNESYSAKIPVSFQLVSSNDESLVTGM